jgi:choline dehydrogenase-like flavoprotein
MNSQQLFWLSRLEFCEFLLNYYRTFYLIEPSIPDSQEEEMVVPGFVGITGYRYYWNVTCQPIVDLNNRTINIPAAKVVGGGTTLNGMMFDRGSKGDYDGWEALGNEGWGWDDLLPYFKKSETFTPPSAELVERFGIDYDPDAHGTSGPVKSSYPPWIWPTSG